MDLATKSLNAILDSDQYDVVRDVPLFDEHDEYDATGKLVRSFTPAKLARIAEVCNARLATGDMAAVGPGHTLLPQRSPITGLIVKPKETDQPPIWGFAGKMRVGPYGPGGRLAVVSDFYMRRQIRLGDQVISGRQAMVELPRRSIELWYEDDLIDRIALLRITPMRDLGLTVAATDQYARQQKAIDRIFSDRQCKRQLAASFSTNGKLCYSMEASMPANDPTMPPDANVAPGTPEVSNDQGHDLNPDEAKTADRYAAYYKSGKCMHYAAGEGPGTPGPSNAFIPGADEKEKDKMPAQFSRPGRPSHGEQPTEADRLRVELDRTKRLGRYEKHLNLIYQDGVELNVEEELAEVARLDLDDAGFERHCKRIVNHYERRPDGGSMVPTRTPVGAKSTSPDEAKRAKSLASTKNISFDAALAEVRGA